MFKRTLRIFVMAFIIAAVTGLKSRAEAVVIVDTGLPSSDSSGLTLNSQNWIAGEFKLTQNYRITDVEAYLFDTTFSSLGPGSLTLAIYGDGGDVPNVADPLFDQVFNVPNAGSGVGADWYGVSGMTLDLLPGEYWIAFEVRSGNTYHALLPVTSPNPIKGAFFNHDVFSEYKPIQLLNNDPGYRIYATSVPDSNPGSSPTTAIPEPGTGCLFLGGVLGLMLAGFKARS